MDVLNSLHLETDHDRARLLRERYGIANPFAPREHDEDDEAVATAVASLEG